MTRKLQFEIPTFSKLGDYQFPYWTVENRVSGQPVNYLSDKYNATYKRVAETMIKLGPNKFQELVLMGLFATNHRTIGDYLQFQFKQANKLIPVIKHTAVIERDSNVCLKIADMENKFESNKQFSIIPSLMRNLTWQPKKPGRPPNGAYSIHLFQKKWSRSVNFIDADLMCNWGNQQELNCIAKIVNMYSAKHCIVHINAISNYPRTNLWSTSQEDIETILDNKILSCIKAKIHNLSINSYSTFSTNNVKTEMTSAVFAITNY